MSLKKSDAYIASYARYLTGLLHIKLARARRSPVVVVVVAPNHVKFLLPAARVH